MATGLSGLERRNDLPHVLAAKLKEHRPIIIWSDPDGRAGFPLPASSAWRYSTERRQMSWELFVGDGIPHREDPTKEAWERIPPLRSWRQRTHAGAPVFDMPTGLADAVNAALHLRRPLLLSGGPGSGKSTLVDLIAAELELGTVLRWHITSKSLLTDALYEYDALGRLHATQAADQRSDPAAAAVANFVTLGPLGTALAANKVRAVLIDEIDKSDLDLPGDLLNVMENGEFSIPALSPREGRPSVYR